MNDDFDWPEDFEIDSAVDARIRARLDQELTARPRARWLVPAVAAAAAVAVVAAGATVMGNSADSPPDPATQSPTPSETASPALTPLAPATRAKVLAECDRRANGGERIGVVEDRDVLFARYRGEVGCDYTRGKFWFGPRTTIQTGRKPVIGFLFSVSLHGRNRVFEGGGVLAKGVTSLTFVFSDGSRHRATLVPESGMWILRAETSEDAVSDRVIIRTAQGRELVLLIPADPMPVPPGGLTNEAIAKECGTYVRDNDRRARRTAFEDFAGGTVGLYRSGDHWMLCTTHDDSLEVTLTADRTGNDPTDAATYALASVLDYKWARYIAGGAALPGVRKISYTFPDGHTEPAVLTKDLWRMSYDMKNQKGSQDVLVTVVSDTGTHEFTLNLDNLEDVCAQIKGGC